MKPQLDDGGNNVYDITVVATDDNGPITQDITVSVTDVNEPPVVSITTTERIAISSTEFPLTGTATDPDTVDAPATYVWSAVTSGGSSTPADVGTFTPTTSPSTAAAVWTPPAVTGAPVNITLTLTVTDSTDGIGTDTHSVTVHQNPPPALTFTNISDTQNAFTVNENLQAVGAANYFAATGGVGTIQYSLTGVDSDLFSISNSGTLTFESAPNFEAPTDDGGNNVYDITVVATDDNGPITQDITVSVTNVNEPPFVEITTTARAVTNPDTFPLRATAIDPETGSFGFNLTWTSTGSRGVFSAGDNKDTRWTPPTITGAPETITLTLTARDNNNVVITDSIDVVVSKAPPAAPVFTNDDTFAETFSVEENQQAVGVLNHFAAPSTTGTVTYSVTGADNRFFTLSNSGTLTFNNAPNFERPRNLPLGFSSDEDSPPNTNIYNINVVATIGSLSTSRAITVTVTDVNDAPVFNTITPSDSFTVDALRNITIVATDEDAGQTLTYALAPNAFGATLIGNTFSWRPSAEDGGETRTFTVTATDDGATPGVVTQDFDITVNRPPTGASIAFTSGATTVPNTHSPVVSAVIVEPTTLGLSATATDPDTDTLIFDWTSATLIGNNPVGSFSVPEESVKMLYGHHILYLPPPQSKCSLL